jgi:hypothetical protein
MSSGSMKQAIYFYSKGENPMIFDPNKVEVRLHPSPLLAGPMAWEAVVSVARSVGADFVCQPGVGEGGLGHMLASWLAEAGPQVALQWSMGGLWEAEKVGARLSVAVMGITPDLAVGGVLSRARELSMWLDIHGDGDAWHPVDSKSETQDWHAQPIVMIPVPPLFRQSCANCHADERATERFVEVGRRTGTGLLWSLRSQPHGVHTERLLARWMERHRGPQSHSVHDEAPPRVRAIQALAEAQPFEVAVAIVGREPVDALVRFAAREAILELGARECHPGAAMALPADLGVHASFNVLNKGVLHGLDRVTSKQLLRWVPGVAEAEEDAEEDTPLSDLGASLMTAHRH